MFRDLMRKEGLTQLRLASKIGVTQSTISQWANGLTSPSTSNLSKLKVVLNVTADELIDCFKKEN